MQSSQENEEQPASQQAAADAGRGQVAVADRSDVAGELAQMEDRYKRALADLDNYRKRSARETERRVSEAGDAQLREWLEVVDSIERAVIMGADSPVAEGMRAVLEQAESILTRQGVRRIGAVGERFDPARHEAVGVQSADGDVPDQTVVGVARSGFMRDGRVLRPAQVIVARASPE